MRSRRGSLWGTGREEHILQFKAGDIVKPVIVTNDVFLGVVRDVDYKLNKVWVAWGSGPVYQYDPDEIMLSQIQDPIVRARMGSTRSRRGKVSKSLVAQHLQNVKSLGVLTDRELTRALRDAVIAEESAINQYETVVDSTENAKAKEVLQEIADEERVHVGELQALLAEMLPDEEDLLEEGADEVEDAGEMMAGVVPGECDGTGPHGEKDGPRVATRRGASFFVAGDPETDPQYMGNPKLHGIESPRGGGFSIMQDLAEDLHKESVKKAGRRGRNAAYWCAPERTYRMTQEEQEKGTPTCPRCKLDMEKEPFTKAEKMWVCPKCRFKVPTGKLTKTRVTIDVDKETGEVDVDVTNARRGSRKTAVAVPADPAVLSQLPRMDLNQIAQVIYDDHRAQGKQVNFAAKPYLQAMSTMRDIKENYMADSGTSIVAYLLGNLTSWGGETARAVKKELNRRLKAAY